MDDLKQNTCQKNPLRLKHICFAMAICLVTMTTSVASAQEANYIWSPQLDASQTGSESSEVYYRKRFSLAKPEKAELHVAAGDQYEVYLNGQLVCRGESYGTKVKLDVSDSILPGINTVAAKVRHINGTTRGIALRLRVKEKGEVRYRSLVSNNTWKTYTRAVDSWQNSRFNDLSWLQANELGVAEVLSLNANSTSTSEVAANSNSTKKAGSENEIIVLNSGKAESTESDATSDFNPRFTIDPEFQIEQILTNEETGSVTCMEYNEFGKIILSQEGGPLLISNPSLSPGDPNRVTMYCDEVSAVQGILPLNGKVYVTGQGPDGQALYLLGDDGDGQASILKTIVKFTGQPSEHGAHGIQLGPDGMLYVILGNGTSVKGQVIGSSPFKHAYEGDLVPRYEDPNGQSVGVKSPGGTIIRTTLDGKRTEIIAGGIRNAYDLVFDTKGNLFFHDSDMETDLGTTWYRPTMIFDAVAGGDFGWRSGWAKFPQHFLDQVPAVVETGRGSPTGAVLYQHINFPLRYQGSMFFADWSEGRILSMRTETRGAGLVGEVKTFATGKPMNICDLAVDPFGAICFCTGGRGTDGGVYRITWKGKVPDEMEDYDTDIARVIRQPQPSSAWGRQQIARLRRKIGADWQEAIVGVATETRNPTDYRVRAMDMMVLFGPSPTPEFLERMAVDSDPDVRIAVARLCGVVNDSDKLTISLLSDGNAMVRRIAAQSALRQKTRPPIESLIPMLKSYDRNEALVARRLLERIPSSEWTEQILGSNDTRIFIQGAAALMIADPSLPSSYKVLARISKLMDGFLNDADFVDILRVAQLAMVRGDVDPQRIPAFAIRVGEEFPSGNSLINQELVRLLACMKNGRLDGRLEAYLSSKDTPDIDKLHVAMLMQTIGRTLPAESKISIIKTLEELKNSAGPDTDVAYIRRSIREMTSTIDADQIPTILENGAQWTDATLATMFLLPKNLTPETVAQIQQIDVAVAGKEGESIKHLRTGIIAVLAQNGDLDSMGYLRQLWAQEPERRSEITLGLAQRPSGENWGYLVSSLNTLDDMTGAEVLGQLVSVQRRPRDAEHYRSVIALGYRLRESGINETVRLLEHWTGVNRPNDGKSWKTTLDDWTKWYEVTFPEGQPILTGNEMTSTGTSTAAILDQLELVADSDALRGHAIFQTANCAKCHRCSGTGNAIGPELTNLASRFSKREMIDAIVNPDAHVADRYRTSVVQLEDGSQVEGMAAKDIDESLVVLLSNGDRVRYAAEEIEAIKLVETSPMPAGSIDKLTPQQISDLLRFMGDDTRTITADAKSTTIK